MPNYSTLTGVEVYIDPSSGHGGNLPDEQPILKLWYYSHLTGLATEIAGGEAQDAQTDSGDYELTHKLEVSGLTYPTPPTYWESNASLMIGVRGEEGNNATAAALYSQGGLIVHPPRVNFTRVRLGEE